MRAREGTVVLFFMASACVAKAPARQLVDVVPVPVSASCPGGGDAILVGEDTNGDGKLEQDEVTSESFVCDGQDGAQPLIDVVPEPPGPNCSAGGSAIQIGLDSNGDGVLEPNEVQSTTYECNPAKPTVIQGSFVVHNQLDAMQLQGVVQVTGDLEIDAPGLPFVDVSHLETVGGKIYVHDNTMTDLDFTSLASVSSVDIENNPGLSLVDLPFGGSVDTLTISNNPSLSDISLDWMTAASAVDFEFDPMLQRVWLTLLGDAGSVDINGNDRVGSLDLSQLHSVGYLALTSDPTLHEALLPALTSAQVVRIAGDTALGSLALPMLADAQSIQISADPALPALDLPDVPALNELYVVGNEALASLTAPQLAVVTDYFDVSTNTSLPTCQVDALLAGLSPPPGSVSVSGDDDAATCP